MLRTKPRCDMSVISARLMLAIWLASEVPLPGRSPRRRVRTWRRPRVAGRPWRTWRRRMCAASRANRAGRLARSRWWRRSCADSSSCSARRGSLRRREAPHTRSSAGAPPRRGSSPACWAARYSCSSRPRTRDAPSASAATSTKHNSRITWPPHQGVPFMGGHKHFPPKMPISLHLRRQNVHTPSISGVRKKTNFRTFQRTFSNFRGWPHRVQKFLESLMHHTTDINWPWSGAFKYLEFYLVWSIFHYRRAVGCAGIIMLVR